MKGISPLISSVLLIAMTVAIASIIFGWMSTFTKETVASVGNKSEEALDCQSASISIDAVYINNTTKTASVIVRNTGWIDNLVLSGAGVFNTTGGNCTLNTSTLDSDFDRSEVATIKFTECPITNCPNDFKEAVVLTSCGGILDVFDSTPVCSS